jgi:IS30 family transposase
MYPGDVELRSYKGHWVRHTVIGAEYKQAFETLTGKKSGHCLFIKGYVNFILGVSR